MGGSIGLTRLFGAAIAAGLIPEDRRTESEAFCGYRTLAERPRAIAIATELRQRGVAVDLFSGTGAVGRQLTYASKKGLDLAILAMGPDSFVVKDLAAGTQVDVPTLESAVQSAYDRVRGAAQASSGRLLSAEQR